jgi:hypothetical protein
MIEQRDACDIYLQWFCRVLDSGGRSGFQDVGEQQ